MCVLDCSKTLMRFIRKFQAIWKHSYTDIKGAKHEQAYFLAIMQLYGYVFTWEVQSTSKVQIILSIKNYL